MSHPNPFEELAQLEEKQDSDIKAPPHVRHKVLDTYHLVTGVFKVLELFLSNAVSTVLNMVDLVSEEDKEKLPSSTSPNTLFHSFQPLSEKKADTSIDQDNKDNTQSKDPIDLTITSPLMAQKDNLKANEDDDGEK